MNSGSSNPNHWPYGHDRQFASILDRFARDNLHVYQKDGHINPDGTFEDLHMGSPADDILRLVERCDAAEQVIDALMRWERSK